jgi:2-polyprenyl-3-methyl-5-hydroxy-6-metoxy-1,4-benzoquinol methylase
MKNIEMLSEVSNVAMDDEWYEFANEDHFWIQWRFAIFKKLQGLLSLNDFKKELFFEIGCGHGVFLSQLVKSGFNAEGCDLNLKALELTESEDLKLMHYNIYDKNEKLKEKYSAVFLMDILEHIQDDLDFLKVSSFYLKKGGYLIINVPAHNFLFSKYDKLMGHQRRYNKQSLKAVLEKANFKIVEIKYWGFSLLPIAILRNFMILFSDEKNIVKKGFNPPNIFAHAFLKFLKKTETSLPFSMPTGTSIIAIAQINN